MASNADDNVSALRALSADQALAWLRAQPGRRTDLRQADLACRCGVSRHVVARRVTSWLKKGAVKRTRDGALVAAPLTEPRARDARSTPHAAQPVREDGSVGQQARNEADARGDGAAQSVEPEQEKPRRAPEQSAAPNCPHGAAVKGEHERPCAPSEQPAAPISAPPTVDSALVCAVMPPPPMSAVGGAPISATVRALPADEALVAVSPGWVSAPISEWHIILTGAAILLDVVVALLAAPGFLLQLSGWPAMAIALCAVVEGGKLLVALFLSAWWPHLGWFRRQVGIVFVGVAMIVSAWGVLNEMAAMHEADRDIVGADVEKDAAEIAILIRRQQEVVADVDRRLQQIDDAIAKATALGRTKGTLQLVEDSKQARTALQEERKREASVLATLESQAAQVQARTRRLEAQASPMRRAVEVLGLASDDRVIERWYFLLVLLLLDPLAIFLATSAGSLRRSSKSRQCVNNLMNHPAA